MFRGDVLFWRSRGAFIVGVGNWLGHGDVVIVGVNARAVGASCEDVGENGGDIDGLTWCIAKHCMCF